MVGTEWDGDGATIDREESNAEHLQREGQLGAVAGFNCPVRMTEILWLGVGSDGSSEAQLRSFPM